MAVSDENEEKLAIIWMPDNVRIVYVVRHGLKSASIRTVNTDKGETGFDPCEYLSHHHLSEPDRLCWFMASIGICPNIGKGLFMFTVNDRNSLYDFVMQLAKDDRRVVTGALVGSLALDGGDRWSDLDLTFSVEDGFPMHDVLEDWTGIFQGKLDAAHFFDIHRDPLIYRVFLLPSCLQCDLSFTPKSKFGPAGPKFKLLLGKYVDKPLLPPPSAMELFGYAVHHILRARFWIELSGSGTGRLNSGSAVHATTPSISPAFGGDCSGSWQGF